MNLFIFAGEHSGDLHGSHLVHRLKSYSPGISVEGVAGPKMRAQGVTLESVVGDGKVMEDFEVMGLSDVICALPSLYFKFIRIRNHIINTKPDAVVLIDYPGFNLKMATALRKQGYQGKIIHYISPSVWAWGKHRIETMAKSLDLLLIIYPFESKYFNETKLKVEYVGNPLSEYLRNYYYDEKWKEKLKIPLNSPIVALFPGSREAEIKRNLPIMLEAASQLKKQFPEVLFGVSCAHPCAKEVITHHPFSESIYIVPRECTYELMRDSRTALAKSGTVTLELALHGTPTVVVYKLTLLNRLYAKYILKLNLPHYCIVNIISGHSVFPELIEKDLSTEQIFEQLKRLHLDGKDRQVCIEECQKIQNMLGGTDTSALAAKAILKSVSC